MSKLKEDVMLVRNLTSEQQKFIVKEIAGEHREYDLYLAPNGSTELENTFVLKGNYEGILEFEGCQCHHEVAPVEKPAEEGDVVPPVDNPEIPPVDEDNKDGASAGDDGNGEKKSDPDSFICDICGAEFASARGLASHKNKVHAQ